MPLNKIIFILQISIFHRQWYFSPFEAGNCVSNSTFKRRKIERNNSEAKGWITLFKCFNISTFVSFVAEGMINRIKLFTIVFIPHGLSSQYFTYLSQLFTTYFQKNQYYLLSLLTCYILYTYINVYYVYQKIVHMYFIWKYDKHLWIIMLCDIMYKSTLKHIYSSHIMFLLVQLLVASCFWWKPD